MHGSDLPIERTLAARIAEDLGLPTDALAPRLAGAAVVTSMGTVTEPVSRGEHERPASAEKTLALVDHTASASRGPSSARGPRARPRRAGRRSASPARSRASISASRRAAATRSRSSPFIRLPKQA